MCHAGFVAHEGGQMDGLGSIVFREGLALATMSARALFGQKAERAVSRMFEFTMTLEKHRLETSD
jgi:hypothetical protein